MLAFSEDEMVSFFRKNDIHVTEVTYTKQVPVYHNRFEDEVIISKCVVNPCNNTVVPVSIAFEKVIYHISKMLLLESITKLHVLNVLGDIKGQPVNQPIEVFET